MAFFFRSNRTPPPPAPDESLLHIPLRSFEVPTLGSRAKVSYIAPTGDAQAESFEKAVRAALGAIEARFSGSEPGGVVFRINAAAGKEAVAVDPDTDHFFSLADSLVFMTQGCVDPTVRPLLSLWRESDGLPANEDVAEAKALVGWRRVQRTGTSVFLPAAGMGLDFGSFLPGMAVETVAVIAREQRVPSALASLGSVHRAVGAEPGKSSWEVEVPAAGAGRSPSRVALMDSALGTAGDGPGVIVGGTRFSSVVDPRSGWPVPPQRSLAAVVGPSALKAPALAMAALIMGVPAGIDFIQAFPGFDGLIEASEGRAVTREWRNRLVGEAR